MKKSISILALALLLGGCAVPTDKFMQDMRKQHISEKILAEIPEMAYCFNVSYSDARAEFGNLFAKHFDQTPIWQKEITPSEAGEYGRVVSEKVAHEYLINHRDTFLKGDLTPEQIRHCSAGFQGERSVAALWGK